MSPRLTASSDTIRDGTEPGKVFRRSPEDLPKVSKKFKIFGMLSERKVARSGLL